MIGGDFIGRGGVTGGRCGCFGYELPIDDLIRGLHHVSDGGAHGEDVALRGERTGEEALREHLHVHDGLVGLEGSDDIPTSLTSGLRQSFSQETRTPSVMVADSVGTLMGERLDIERTYRTFAETAATTSSWSGISRGLEAVRCMGMGTLKR